jgi:GNAT superfamily N-acetyltransferase
VPMSSGEWSSVGKMAPTTASTSALRPAEPRDVPDILRLIIELAVYEKEPNAVKTSEADLHAALFGENPQVFAHVAEHDGTVIGFALWYITFSTWTGRHGIWLEDLYVSPDHRGSGLGKALLAELAGICVERGYTRLEWWVLDWNSPAIGFYDSLSAHSMDEWTVRRLDGAALADLAR